MKIGKQLRNIFLVIFLVLIVWLCTNCVINQKIPIFNGIWSLNQSTNMADRNQIWKFKDQKLDIKIWNTSQEIQYATFNESIWLKIPYQQEYTYQLFFNYGDNSKNTFQLKKGYNIDTTTNLVDTMILFNKGLDYGIYHSQSQNSWNLQSRQFTQLNYLSDGSLVIGIPYTSINQTNIQTVLVSKSLNNKILSTTEYDVAIDIMTESQNRENALDQQSLLKFVPLDGSREFKFVAESLTTIYISTFNLVSGQDTVLELYDSNNLLVQKNDDSVDLQSEIRYLVNETEEYTVKVSAWENRYIGYYDLTLFRKKDNPDELSPIITLLTEGFESGSINTGIWVTSQTIPTIQTTYKQQGNYGLQFKTVQNGLSTMQTSVSLLSTGLLSFYYRVSSEYAYDYLAFYVNDALIGKWSGELTSFQYFEYFFKTSGTYRLKWEFKKDGTIDSYTNSQWLDTISVIDNGTLPANISEFTEGFENELTVLPWIRGGNVLPNTATTLKNSGLKSLQFGYITHNQKSNISITVSLTKIQELSFYYRTSSEQNYDFLRLYVDNQLIQQWSGIPTTKFTLYKTSISQGSHTIKWEYSKNGNISNNADTQWIDDIKLSYNTISNNIPLQFTYIQPQNNSTNMSISSIPFSWNQSTYATSYNLWFKKPTDANFQVIYATTTSNTVNSWVYNVYQLSNSTTYQWKVEQRNNYGSYMGPVYTFTTVQQVAPQTISSMNEGFETGSFSKYPWVISGSGYGPNVQSTVKLQGTYQVQFGSIQNSQKNGLTITVQPTQTSVLSFYYKVSSEANYDKFQLIVNGSILKNDSGNKDWQLYSCGLNQNTLYAITFEYIKDGSGIQYSDTQWIDEIKIEQNVTPGGPLDFIGPIYNGNVLLITNYSTSSGNYSGSGNVSQTNDRIELEQVDDGSIYQLNPIRELPLDSQVYEIAYSTPTGLEERVTTKLWYVFNFQTNKDYQITCTLQYSGQYSTVWVESTTDITVQKQQQIANEFDNLIYPNVNTYFQAPSNIDGDGKTQILCYDIQDGFTGSGGYIAGYFYGGDLLNVQYSNRTEVINIDTYPAMKSSTSGEQNVTNQFDTIAHEFQHLVNFNSNYIIEGISMNTVLNEGLSMQQEHLIYGTITSRINYYNNYSDSYQSVIWWNQDLYSYSLSYLFIQYVKQQTTNDNTIYKILIEDRLNGFDLIDKYTKIYNPDIGSVQELIVSFRLQLLLKQSEGKYSFKNGQFNVLNTRYNNTQNNVSLRGGGQFFKQITGSFTQNNTQGATTRFVGITK